MKFIKSKKINISKYIIPIFMMLILSTPMITTDVKASPIAYSQLKLHEEINGTDSHYNYYNFTSNSQMTYHNRTGLASLVIHQYSANYTAMVSIDMLELTMTLNVQWSDNGTIFNQYVYGYTTSASNVSGNVNITFVIPSTRIFTIENTYLEMRLALIVWMVPFPVTVYYNRVYLTNGVVAEPEPEPPATDILGGQSGGFLIGGSCFFIAGILIPALAMKKVKNHDMTGIGAFCLCLVAIPLCFGVAFALFAVV